MQHPGPREQIDAALDHLSAAVSAIDRANACIVSKRDDSKAWRTTLATARADLQILAGRMRDARDELTPVRPASDPAMRAAFENASTFPSWRPPR